MSSEKGGGGTKKSGTSAADTFVNIIGLIKMVRNKIVKRKGLTLESL